MIVLDMSGFQTEWLQVTKSGSWPGERAEGGVKGAGVGTEAVRF